MLKESAILFIVLVTFCSILFI